MLLKWRERKKERENENNRDASEFIPRVERLKIYTYKK